jgi:two-component system, chemotaxis family, protein-glutamate methylesterase/glutaminase
MTPAPATIAQAASPPSHLPFRAVAIAASAGGLPAIRAILSQLPADFPVPILIVQHLAAAHPSVMAELLDAHTSLRVRWAVPGDKLEAGTAYLASPGLHLTVDGEGVLALPDTDKVRSCRPSADVLFNSVALSFGPRAICIVLTGTGFDGGDGAGAMQRAGGSVIAQDQTTSTFFSMPHAAILATTFATVLPIRQIAPALVALATKGALS